jgi:cation-transporting ATPase E
MTLSKPKGLSSAEVAERVRRGQVNSTPRSNWADYRNIIARNLFTWFNAMVTPAAIGLIAMREYQGALAVTAMAILNSLLGLVEEIKSKWHLDKLTLLVETKARVLRDGQVREISAGDVVLDEHILLSAGDAVVADGHVLQSRFLEVDEALLTGESDPVRRQPGDRLLSGSFCVAGEGAYRADKVGAEAFANQTSAQARRYAFTASPLTRIINLLIQILSYTAIGLCGLYLVVFLLHPGPNRTAAEAEFVRRAAATITSMVPQGLVLTATVAFTLGAVTMSRRGAVVQRLNAVETMAQIDVICTDKTGTLTTNQLRLDQLRVFYRHRSEDEVRRLLRLFVSASVDRQNKNVQALRAALGETPVELLDQLPFKSQHRYSAVRVRDGDLEQTLVLGACEALQKHLLEPSSPFAQEAKSVGGVELSNWEPVWKELLTTGLRILMFAESPRHNPFAGTLDGFPLRALALVALSDELRPDAEQVLDALAGQGIAFKVLSGDNPETVRATVRHLTLPLAHEPVVSGDELDVAPNRAELIRTRGVFGRVSPQQKVEIVQTLKDQGRHVAMIGDGVNDVLPIKRADLGIAMGDGSQASKTVSGLVLENNDFALLPETLEEGRTIVRNLRRSAKLFLTKNVYSLILILPGAVGLFGLPFPYLPQQVTLLNWLVIGIPAFIIALTRERSVAPIRPRFLREVGWFAVRTGVVFALAGLATLLISIHGLGDDLRTQRTLLLSVLIFLGITALLRALTDAEPQPLRGDVRLRWVAVAAVPAYLAAMYVPISSQFFKLTPLTDVRHWLLVLAVVFLAYGLSIFTDRWQL